jgi:hypothetical protein
MTQQELIIDLRPLFDQVVFPIVGTVLTGFAAWAVAKISKLAHIQLTQAQARTLEGAMQNGINFALQRAQAAADAHGQVTTKQEIVALAVNYVVPKVPQAMNSLGVSNQGLAERIEARLFGTEVGAK